MALEMPVVVDFVTGDSTGLKIPAHGEALRQTGIAFLNQAFRAFGAIAPDNRVVRITEFAPCDLGSTGQKFFLSVEYANNAAELPAELFVKFSRDFSDPFRDYRRGDTEAEINLASLSRNPNFPIAVPRAFFADFHRESGTGIIITERIRFGDAGIEPAHAKCMDHELADPLEYYRTMLTALARLAGAHKSGALSPQLETLFPFDPEIAAMEDPIPYSEARIVEQVRAYAKFAQNYPQLVPPNIATPQFIARLEREAPALLRHQNVVRRFLHKDPDYIAFCHFNTNIDNAWFWRDDSGVLQCGLLDWQRARQMNFGLALWGGLSGAGLNIWDHDLDPLLAMFIGVLQSHGGPSLDLAALQRYLGLYAALMGLTGLLNAPSIVLRKFPEAATASGPLDPVFAQSEAARTVLHMLSVLLNFWEKHDVGASLDFVLARAAQA